MRHFPLRPPARSSGKSPLRLVANRGALRLTADSGTAHNLWRRKQGGHSTSTTATSPLAQTAPRCLQAGCYQPSIQKSQTKSAARPDSQRSGEVSRHLPTGDRAAPSRPYPEAAKVAARNACGETKAGATGLTAFASSSPRAGSPEPCGFVLSTPSASLSPSRGHPSRLVLARATCAQRGERGRAGSAVASAGTWGRTQRWLR